MHKVWVFSLRLLFFLWRLQSLAYKPFTKVSRLTWKPLFKRLRSHPFRKSSWFCLQWWRSSWCVEMAQNFVSLWSVAACIRPDRIRQRPNIDKQYSVKGGQKKQLEERKMIQRRNFEKIKYTLEVKKARKNFPNLT